MKCKNCQAEYPDTELFCPNCGAPTQKLDQETLSAVDISASQGSAIAKLILNPILILQFLLGLLIFNDPIGLMYADFFGLSFSKMASMWNIINIVGIVIVALAGFSRMFIPAKRSKRLLLLISVALVLLGFLFLYIAPAVWMLVFSRIVSYLGLALLVYAVSTGDVSDLLSMAVGLIGAFLLSFLLNALAFPLAFSSTFRMPTMIRAVVSLILYILLIIFTGKHEDEPRNKNIAINTLIWMLLLLVAWLV